MCMKGRVPRVSLRLGVRTSSACSVGLEDAHAQMYHVVHGHVQVQILIEFLKSYRQTYTHLAQTGQNKCLLYIIVGYQNALKSIEKQSRLSDLSVITRNRGVSV